MSEIKISKIKVRRGTDDQRKKVIFDQGELAYTTDTKRLFVGNGVLSGGDAAGSVFHLPLTTYGSLSSLPAVRGDVVSVSSKTYQLTGSDPTNLSNWMDITLKISSDFKFSSTNTLTVSNSAISAVCLKPETISNGLKIESNILQTSFNTKSLEISATKLSLKTSGIDEREISSTTFGNGISGGSGNKVSLKIDPQHFYFSGGVLSLSLSSMSVSSYVVTVL